MVDAAVRGCAYGDGVQGPLQHIDRAATENYELWTCVLAEHLPDLGQVAEAPAGLATDFQFGRLRRHFKHYLKAAVAIFTVGAMMRGRQPDSSREVLPQR